MTDEVYHFMNLRYDISRINSDIASGKLRPKKIDIHPSFIEEFAEKVQSLKRNVKPQDQRVGIFSSVNALYAMSLPVERLEEPLVFLHTPQGKGILDLDGSGLNYLLADGQHRLARAFMDGRDTPLQAYQLSKKQSLKYML